MTERRPLVYRDGFLDVLPNGMTVDTGPNSTEVIAGSGLIQGSGELSANSDLEFFIRSNASGLIYTNYARNAIGNDGVALTQANTSLSLVTSGIAIGNAALASGNNALEVAEAALASGNAALDILPDLRANGGYVPVTAAGTINKGAAVGYNDAGFIEQLTASGEVSYDPVVPLAAQSYPSVATNRNLWRNNLHYCPENNCYLATSFQGNKYPSAALIDIDRETGVVSEVRPPEILWSSAAEINYQFSQTCSIRLDPICTPGVDFFAFFFMNGALTSGYMFAVIFKVENQEITVTDQQTNVSRYNAPVGVSLMESTDVYQGSPVAQVAIATRYKTSSAYSVGVEIRPNGVYSAAAEVATTVVPGYTNIVQQRKFQGYNAGRTYFLYCQPTSSFVVNHLYHTISLTTPTLANIGSQTAIVDANGQRIYVQSAYAICVDEETTGYEEGDYVVWAINRYGGVDEGVNVLVSRNTSQSVLEVVANAVVPDTDDAFKNPIITHTQQDYYVLTYTRDERQFSNAVQITFNGNYTADITILAQASGYSAAIGATNTQNGNYYAPAGAYNTADNQYVAGNFGYTTSGDYILNAFKPLISAEYQPTVAGQPNYVGLACDAVSSGESTPLKVPGNTYYSDDPNAYVPGNFYYIDPFSASLIPSGSQPYNFDTQVPWTYVAQAVSTSGVTLLKCL